MIKDDEVKLLINDILEIYGYDFTNYTLASLKRRVTRLYLLDRHKGFYALRNRVQSDPEYVKRFVEEVTVNVTEMFRDPGFYKVLRTEVLPVLATYPFIRIWHAGCSTGEEVYSMAILLHEAGLLQRSLIYATDLNVSVLERAREGIFPLSQMKQYSENYILSGGLQDFSSYYTANYDRGKLNDLLKEKILFSSHNLVSDSSFNEFHIILCRNVLIYFDKPLQDRVLTLFDESLAQLAFLALGSKETLKFSHISGNYKQIGKEKLWRKMV